MGWTEPACVAYLLIFVVVNVTAHCLLRRRGKMHWDVMTWSSIGRGIGPCNAAFMAFYRLLFAAYVLMVDWVMWRTPPIDVATGEPLQLESQGGQANLAKTGPMIFATFTVWSWTLVGVYFAITGVISVLLACGYNPQSRWPKAFCCFVWAMFEVMFSCAILICICVWLILLPMMYMLFGTDMGMLSWTCLSAHNVNVVFMLTEACLNRLCFVPAHYVFVVYYGASYVVFSWIFFYFHGIFFYFFIDWRHWFALVGYTVLLASLAMYFFLGRCLVNRVKYRSSSTLLISKLPTSDTDSESETGGDSDELNESS